MTVKSAKPEDETAERGVPIRSVSRSLAVLQAVNAAGSLSLMQIARSVSLPYATVVRLVATLVHEGMIEREPDRKHYRPTVLVQSLSSGYKDHSQLGAIARPHIVALTAKHGWAVAVSTRFGMNMIVREGTHAVARYNLSTYYPGFVYPMMQSAAGLVYMAFSSERERQALRQELAQAHHVDTVGLMAISEEALDDIRRRGFATRGRNRFTMPEGKNSAIAAPIFQDGQMVATLALVFLASTLSMDMAVQRCAQDVMDTARDVGASLSRARSNL